MAEKVQDYENFLKDLVDRVDEADASKIRSLLEKVRERYVSVSFPGD